MKVLELASKHRFISRIITSIPILLSIEILIVQAASQGSFSSLTEGFYDLPLIVMMCIIVFVCNILSRIIIYDIDNITLKTVNYKEELKKAGGKIADISLLGVKGFITAIKVLFYTLLELIIAFISNIPSMLLMIAVDPLILLFTVLAIVCIIAIPLGLLMILGLYTYVIGRLFFWVIILFVVFLIVEYISDLFFCKIYNIGESLYFTDSLSLYCKKLILLIFCFVLTILLFAMFWQPFLNSTFPIEYRWILSLDFDNKLANYIYNSFLILPVFAITIPLYVFFSNIFYQFHGQVLGYITRKERAQKKVEKRRINKIKREQKRKSEEKKTF